MNSFIRKMTALILSIIMVCTLAACSNQQGQSGGDNKSGLDYMVLVNKQNPLPDGWEDTIETVTFENTAGWEVEVEKKSYDAYLELKKELEKEDIYVDLDSARRSIAEQQRIMDDFIKKYGEDYAKKTVAQPGYSEHHTGLALDLYLIIDGKDVVENEDMIVYTDIWAKIHDKLAKHGFILRYLKDKEHITGYGYEPWHIRYIDDPDKAKEIMSKGMTLEGYLGAVNETDVDIDYGNSKLYKKDELEEAVVQIKCQFAYQAGCEMHSLRYAGDECNSKKNIEWINSLNDGSKYVEVCEFLCNFHSPKESEETTFDLDKEYEDYQYWLAREKGKGWEVVSSGY